MAISPGIAAEILPRTALVRVAAGFLALLLAISPATAALLPAGFFDMQIRPGEGPAAVEADRLSYDGVSDVISAEGGVMMSYQGYTIRADRLTYNQRSGELHAVGSVAMRDPTGNVYEMDSIEVTGAFKEAFLDSLTLTTPEGAVITARDVRYSSELATILTEAAYSPCGLCVDSKGRRIGWKVKAARIIYDRDSASVVLEQPSLELLGIPVAWLPWFWVPDPTQPRARGLRMPSIGGDEQRGASLIVPYFVPVGEDLDLVLTPTLMSRQGFLMGGELTWRLPGYGQIDVQASGLYQLDKNAFAGEPGFRDWRGAIQTSGHFTPIEHWTAGWSYAAFTDPAYLVDYELVEGKSNINQAYVTHLTEDTYLDARIQRFNRLGNIGPTDDAQQGINLPLAKFSHVQDLEPGWGRLSVNGELNGIHREADQTATYNAVPYVFGYEGNKAHAMVEGAWENQFILPGGVAATPYLGARLDGAWYDGGSSLPGAPPAAMMFSATPIAAMDVRWPLMAVAGDDTHLFEPVAQLVYRGSSTTDVGITNDNAQSFVFDETNLFSYNRFSGIDRQETGLRANIGGHYLGNFADGSWLELVAGQSFHLAGLNALGVTDAAQVGTDTGLGTTSSYIVASAQGGFANGFRAGGKVQIDPAGPRVTRAGLGASFGTQYFSVNTNYIYIAAQPTLGVVDDQHEVSVGGSVPVFDYWTLSGRTAWNLDTMSWASSDAGVAYDDGYLNVSGTAGFTPTSWSWGLHLKLKGPDGEVAF